MSKKPGGEYDTGRPDEIELNEFRRQQEREAAEEQYNRPDRLDDINLPDARNQEETDFGGTQQVQSDELGGTSEENRDSE